MWIATKDELPPEGKYVLGRYNGGNWIDRLDQENVNCVVVKLEKGISIEEREKMISGELPDPLSEPMWCLSSGFTRSKRSNIYQASDQHGNNAVPYNWKTFGRSSFFGQEITHWQPIEPLNEKTT